MRRACAVLAMLSLIACGGEKQADSDDDEREEGESSVEATPVSFDPSTITASELALGDSLYHGLIGATSCQSCHGPDGTQATVAPNLTDAEWLHSDGSLEGIYKTIETGVMSPKQFSGVMPPWGGPPLDKVKHHALAAYVYKLGHK